MGENLEWKIYEEYQIVGHMEKGDPMDAYKMDFKDKPLNPKCFIFPNRPKNKGTYEPSKIEDIFLKFCKVAEQCKDGTEAGMEQEALKWIGKYGLLHDYEKDFEHGKKLRDEDIIQYSVEYFFKQVGEANSALHIYTQFLDRYNQDRLEWNKESDDFYNEVIIPQLNIFFDAQLKRMRPCIRHDKDASKNPKRKIVADYMFPDLLTMMWWQFYGIVTSQTNIRRCWFCNDWINPNIGNQKFCPVPKVVAGADNHSDCAKRYYSWLFKQKDKAKDIWLETRDIEATRKGIAKKYEVDIKTIEKWIPQWEAELLK